MTTPTLLPLLDYLKHTLLLGEKPVHTVDGGEGLVEHQASLATLPGVSVAESPEEGAPWLTIERLVKSLPPDPEPEFAAWFDVPAGPYDLPVMRDRPREAPEPVDLGDGTLMDPLAGVDRAPIEAALAAYTAGAHATWAARERLQLRTVKLYRQLFTLAETLAQNPDRELVWGWGVALWKHPAYATPMRYPLLTQSLDLTIDPRTQQIAVIPTASPVHAELNSFLSAKVPGAVRLKSIWEDEPTLAQTLTPFDDGLSRDFFQQAVSLLDADGQLLTDTTLKGPALPAPGRFLQVAERWLVFDRKRSSAALILDLSQLAKHAATLADLPKPALALLTAPEDQVLDDTQVTFNGVYDGNLPATGDLSSPPPRELYFPLPYNEEQVRVAENVEADRSQVVQGPPGTGKSHTIANIMAHSMAMGKSLLVTSKGAPALKVIRDKLPAELRALCVFMLQGEKDGMREFEASIDHLAQQISRLDAKVLATEISELDVQLDSLHSQMAAVDRDVLGVARQHLAPLMVGGAAVAALDLVERQRAGAAIHGWLADAVDVAGKAPELPVEAILALRTELGEHLPLLADPKPDQAWSVTEARAVHDSLTGQVDRNQALLSLGLTWPKERSDRTEAVTQWHQLLAQSQAVLDHPPGWLPAFELAWLRAAPEVKTTLGKLAHAIRNHVSQASAFVLRPVDVPENVPLADLQAALALRLNGGSKLTRWMSEPKIIRAALAAVLVEGQRATEADSPHVLSSLNHAIHGQRLRRKWLAVAGVLALPHSISDAEWAAVAERALGVTKLISAAGKAIEASGVIGVNPPTTVVAVAEAMQRMITWDELDVASCQAAAYRQQVQEAQTEARSLGEGTFARTWAGALSDMSGHPNNPQSPTRFDVTAWQGLNEAMAVHRQFKTHYQDLLDHVVDIQRAGAPQWARALATETVRDGERDAWCPTDWADAWAWRQADRAVTNLPGLRALADLHATRQALDEQLNATRQKIIVKRTWLRVLERATPAVRVGLEAYLKAVKKIGKGTGKAAGRHRQDARVAMAAIYQAIPCWVMPHDRAIEFLPSRIGDFDLVVLDEASQSDLRALPALLRGKQWLIVGDEKQVSPANVGKIDEEEMLRLRRQYLKDAPFAAQLTPDNSVYDLCKVALVAQGAQVVLVEHFRCHPAIIEFSNREYYNHGLKALRIQKASEKLDPPLVDVLVRGGTRKGKLNLPEARFIVDEIKALTDDPNNAHRTIGVVSLLGTEQVARIQDMILAELGEEVITRHQIECGDAARFQGKERSIMFMSMVATPDDNHPATRLDDRQRFNVAASRARDRLYLVRSVGAEDLNSQDDQKRKLVAHFHSPFVVTEEERQQAARLFDSPFEKDVYERLVRGGYRVRAQVPAGSFRIDLVVLGSQGKKLAVECDGDRFHGLDRWPADMARQRTLERVGWTFWRCFASSWYRDTEACFADLVTTLNQMGIEPGAVADDSDEFWVEHRSVSPVVVEDAPKRSKKTTKAHREPTDEADGRAVDDTEIDVDDTEALMGSDRRPTPVVFGDDPGSDERPQEERPKAQTPKEVPGNGAIAQVRGKRRTRKTGGVSPVVTDLD